MLNRVTKEWMYQTRRRIEQLLYCTDPQKEERLMEKLQARCLAFQSHYKVWREEYDKSKTN